MTSSSKGPPRNVPPPTGPAKPGATQNRFIPREELSSFAAWSLGELSGGEQVERRSVQRPEPPAAPKQAPTPDVAEQIRGARHVGYQDGYRDGLAALDEFKESFATQMTAQIGMLTQAYSQQLDALQQDMARALAVTATHLARQIARSELEHRPEIVIAVAQEALDTLLLSAHHITVRVHPDDHALVLQGAADVLASRGARLLADSKVTRGGCLVESDIGVIDASLETRWRRAAAALGCDGDWDASAPPAPAEDEGST